MEQRIKERKNAVNWTRLSCHRIRHKVVRFQLYAFAYNLCNFLLMLALPETVQHWLLTTLPERLIKLGAKVVRHGRGVTFQLLGVAMPRGLFADSRPLIDGLRAVALPL